MISVGARSPWPSRSPGSMPVEAALEAAAIARHGKAAQEEHRGREDIALLGEAEPGRILQRLLDGAEHVDEADDGHERRVLEQVDDVVDDPGHDYAKGLRQGHEELNLPPAEAERCGRLLLPCRDAPQAAPPP